MCRLLNLGEMLVQLFGAAQFKSYCHFCYGILCLSGTSQQLENTSAIAEISVEPPLVHRVSKQQSNLAEG